MYRSHTQCIAVIYSLYIMPFLSLIKQTYCCIFWWKTENCLLQEGKKKKKKRRLVKVDILFLSDELLKSIPPRPSLEVACVAGAVRPRGFCPRPEIKEVKYVTWSRDVKWIGAHSHIPVLYCTGSMQVTAKTQKTTVLYVPHTHTAQSGRDGGYSAIKCEHAAFYHKCTGCHHQWQHGTALHNTAVWGPG